MSSNDPPRSPPRSKPMHASQSMYNTVNLGASSSRPFLNMLNPMNPKYQGYTRAPQAVLQEEEDENETNIDLEAGVPHQRTHKPTVSWDAADPAARDDSDDEVPQSFMVEATPKSRGGKGKAKAPPIETMAGVPPGVAIPPRPSEVGDGERESEETSPDEPVGPQRVELDPYQRALWNWVNVYNLDAFLQDVYAYYEGKGIYSIALAKGFNLLTVGFVIGFSTFLLGCIDYSRIRPEKVTRLSDVIVDRCVSRFSGFTLLFFILFTTFYAWQIFNYVVEILRLVDMYNFYTYLLKIPDADIQTILWPEVVRRIGAIRQDNPVTAMYANSHTNTKLDAHDIANRIMRQENYLIALFNKDLLDLRVPLPAFLKPFIGDPQDGGKGRMLTRALEWNLRFCLMEYLFDQQGRVRKVFLKRKHRQNLIEGLERRFIFMGMLNAIFAPFIVPYILLYSFFRYFEEYHKNPSNIGSRRYTQYAQWKFREFNELPHVFTRRLRESYDLASMYIGQFPNERMTISMRFVAFIAGAFASVLAAAAMLDADVIVHFEITPNRTVLFYLGIFSSIFAATRGMIPEDNRIYEAEVLMEEVIRYTHYMPDHWKGELHSKKVNQEFGELFAMRVLIFVQEFLSVVLTPFVLWFSLPACAPAIIDFFREFTVHVDGRGYVCSFAEFNFERHGNVKFGAPAKVADQRMISNEGKMEKSFLNFKAANPDWKPTDPSGSLYLSRMVDLQARRRPGMENTILLGKSQMYDREQGYDRALLQSQHAAMRRRLGPGSMAISGSSVFGGPGMAQTAVLGDSEGSIMRPPPPPPPQPQPPTENLVSINEQPLEGEVVSGLGDSYMDGGRRAMGTIGEEDANNEGDEILEDGGLLGLLTQIYGTKGATQGPTRTRVL